MKTRTIVIKDYQSSWVDEFNKIKNELEIALNNCYLSIEHVGSTSVVGLKAKPIIDIDIIINDINDFNGVKSVLESIGYIHEGNKGVEGREAFIYNQKAHLMRHHLYVCHKDNIHLKRHLVLKNHLNHHQADVIKYGQLKEELAKKYPHDIDRYIDGKTDFILSIYKIYNLDKINEASHGYL